jgi:hypothetical protein
MVSADYCCRPGDIQIFARNRHSPYPVSMAKTTCSPAQMAMALRRKAAEVREAAKKGSVESMAAVEELMQAFEISARLFEAETSGEDLFAGSE